MTSPDQRTAAVLATRDLLETLAKGRPTRPCLAQFRRSGEGF